MAKNHTINSVEVEKTFDKILHMYIIKTHSSLGIEGMRGPQLISYSTVKS